MLSGRGMGDHHSLHLKKFGYFNYSIMFIHHVETIQNNVSGHTHIAGVFQDDT